MAKDLYGEPRGFAPHSGDLDGVRVLVVDDDDDVVDLYATALGSAGAVVSAANDGVEALDTLAAGSFDVVVSDIDMPGLGGIGLMESTRSLDEHFASVPALAITANVEPVTKAHAIAAGFDAFAAKPVGGKELVALVASVLRTREPT